MAYPAIDFDGGGQSWQNPFYFPLPIGNLHANSTVTAAHRETGAALQLKPRSSRRV
jgi:hypothetical protein